MNFKCLQSIRAKSVSVLTLKFSKEGKYFATKKCFKKFYKINVFFKRYNKNCFRSGKYYSYATRYIYVKSSQSQ